MTSVGLAGRRVLRPLHLADHVEITVEIRSAAPARRSVPAREDIW